MCTHPFRESVIINNSPSHSCKCHSCASLAGSLEASNTSTGQTKMGWNGSRLITVALSPDDLSHPVNPKASLSFSLVVAPSMVRVAEEGRCCQGPAGVHETRDDDFKDSMYTLRNGTFIPCEFPLE